MRIGFSHRQAVVLLWCVGALLGVLALLLPTLKPYQAVLVFAHAIGFAAVVAFFIQRGEKAAGNRP